MELNWELDGKTKLACENYAPFLGDMRTAQQYQGHNFIVKNWQRRILNKDDFKDNVVCCSPSEIDKCFREQRYLAGLALVVSWGGMARTSKYIYDHHSLDKIENVLCECYQNITETKRIDDSWHMLTVDLDWSAVISSKTLHFMCRSLGCESNPPVAIDNAIILKKVWPSLKNNLSKSLHPQNWSGKTFSSYNRYMTAILVWGSQRHWTTTQVENTIFDYLN